MSNETADQSGVAWQRRAETGLLKALIETVREVLLKPESFFQKLRPSNSLAEPFMFFIIVFLIAFIANQVLNKFILRQGPAAAFTVGYTLGTVGITMVSIFLWSGWMHLFVRLFGGKGSYQQTFAILSYATATQIVSFIPFLGGWIAGIWNAYAAIIGYKKIHQLSVGKACFAYILAFSILLIGFVGLAGSYLQAMKGMRSRPADVTSTPLVK